MNREDAFDAEVQQHLRRNYVAHVAHGLLGQSGFRLIQAPTFIPAYVFMLSGSNVVVGLARALQALGMALTPIFAATVIEHRPKVLPVGLVVGTMMRVQVLGIALSGFFLPREWNVIAVCTFLGLFGFFLGMQAVIFNLLISKVIPVQRRGLLVGSRNFLAGLLTAVVAGLGGWFLEHDALGNGYASTFLAAFVLAMAGLCVLLLVREPASPVVREKTGVAARLRDVPALLRGDRGFTFYFVARALGAAGRMAVPFYVVYAGTKVEISGVDLGWLTIAFVVAQSIAQLLWGLLADRTGFRAVFVAAIVTWIVSVIVLLQTSSLGGLLVVFAALGIGLGGFMLAANNLVLEFGARENLPIRIAVANTASEAVNAVAPLGAGLLADAVSYTPVFVVAIVFKLLALVLVLFHVDEPRARGGDAPV